MASAVILKRDCVDFSGLADLERKREAFTLRSHFFVERETGLGQPGDKTFVFLCALDPRRVRRPLPCDVQSNEREVIELLSFAILTPIDRYARRIRVRRGEHGLFDSSFQSSMTETKTFSS